MRGRYVAYTAKQQTKLTNVHTFRISVTRTGGAAVAFTLNYVIFVLLMVDEYDKQSLTCRY
jgi:hypothetical protein